MANRFKEKLKGSGETILTSGKEKETLEKPQQPEKIKESSNKRSYISSPGYEMWTQAKPDKAAKGGKYQLNITISEENLKKQMAMEYKMGINRHKMSELPNKAISILYDIVFLLGDDKNVLDMEIEEILKLVAEKMKAV